MTLSLTHALKWSFLSELAAKTIPPVVYVVLARLLTPQDFGVMTAALMIVAFSNIFWEAGMSKALIQRQADVEEAADAAFWINIALGILISALLCVLSEPVARTFFHDARVTAVIRVMTLAIFFSAVSAVHTALLQKGMGFKALFWVRFATIALPGFASIPLAWWGMGYWALVAGTLLGQAAKVVVLWRMSDWRPRWSFNVRVAKELGRFGLWVGGSGLLTWFYGWADSLIVGMYLGEHELGLYRTGNLFAAMIFAFLFAPVSPVLYSHLSRTRQDAGTLRVTAQRILKVLTLVAVPIALIVFSLADPLGAALFGEKWQGIGLVIGVMALMHGFSWVVGMNGEVYRAMGKPSYETIVTAAVLVFYLAAYLISIRYGFASFVWTRLGLALCALVLHLWVISYLLAMPMFPVARYLVGITATVAVAVFAVRQLLKYMGGAWSQVILGGLLEISIIAAMIFLIERNGMVKEVRSMIGKGAA